MIVLSLLGAKRLAWLRTDGRTLDPRLHAVKGPIAKPSNWAKSINIPLIAHCILHYYGTYRSHPRFHQHGRSDIM